MPTWLVKPELPKKTRGHSRKTMNTQHEPNGISRNAFLRMLALAAPLLPAATALAQADGPTPAPEPTPDLGNLRAFVELARSDIRTQKAYIIAQNLPLTEAEAVEFWPLQREYEGELNKLLDERYAGIVQFARDYGTMTDTQATALATKAFGLEEKRTALKRRYFKQFIKVVPAVKAARFFQIENQLNMALDLRVAGALPLIK
jgi:hypothetical protein